MKVQLPLILVLIMFIAKMLISQQNHLDVEGHVKIRGNIDINHMEDTTSLYIGREAGIITDFSVRRFNSFVGSNAGLKNTEGFANSFFGRLTGGDNTTGSYNSFFGTNAGLHNTEGDFNSFFGYLSGQDNTTGSANSFFGLSAGFKNTEGQNNSFYGLNTGYNNTTGGENSYFGRSAGGTPSTSTRNTFIGFEADQLSADSLDRAIAIGYNAKVNCSHCAVIGGTGGNAVNVGISTDSPQSKFHIQGTGAELTLKADITNQDNSGSIVFDEGTGEKHFRIQYDGATGDGGGRLTFKDFNIGTLLTIVRDGKVGIGTETPTVKLDVKGTTSVGVPGDGNTLLHFNTDRSWVFRQLGTGASTALELAVANSGNANKNFVISTTANVGIGRTNPVHPLHMASGAHVTAGGVWTNSSSRALKENISDLTLEEASLTLAELNPVKFNYLLQKDEEYIGFIAEDVPELVATHDRKSLSPMDFVAVLTKVVQDQEQRIQVLNEQVSEISSLKNEIAELKEFLKTYMEEGANED